MSERRAVRGRPRRMLGAVAIGLLLIASVPGIGWLWGQFWETVVLCLGGALLIYAAFAYMLAINGRLAALEQRISELDRRQR